ncbi:hypothetical protein V8F20_007722 [Naviculisporaceae sp. PSN 640]
MSVSRCREHVRASDIIGQHRRRRRKRVGEIDDLRCDEIRSDVHSHVSVVRTRCAFPSAGPPSARLIGSTYQGKQTNCFMLGGPDPGSVELRKGGYLEAHRHTLEPKYSPSTYEQPRRATSLRRQSTRSLLLASCNKLDSEVEMSRNRQNAPSPMGPRRRSTTGARGVGVASQASKIDRLWRAASHAASGLGVFPSAGPVPLMCYTKPQEKKKKEYLKLSIEADADVMLQASVSQLDLTNAAEIVGRLLDGVPGPRDVSSGGQKAFLVSLGASHQGGRSAVQPRRRWLSCKDDTLAAAGQAAARDPTWVAESLKATSAHPPPWRASIPVSRVRTGSKIGEQGNTSPGVALIWVLPMIHFQTGRVELHYPALSLQPSNVGEGNHGEPSLGTMSCRGIASHRRPCAPPVSDGTLRIAGTRMLLALGSL